MIVVFGTRKGGAGKSSMAVNIAALRKMNGHDVCLVDCDDQRSVTSWVEDRNEAGLKPDLPLINALGKGVGESIRNQAKRYSDLVVDVPGRDADELRLSVVVADVLVLPLKIGYFDLKAIHKDIELISGIQMQRKQLGLPLRSMFFFNEVSTLPSVRNKQLNKMAEELLKVKDALVENDIEVSPVLVSDREAYKKTLWEGSSVFEVGEGVSTGSDHTAQEEIRGLYDFIYGKA